MPTPATWSRPVVLGKTDSIKESASEVPVRATSEVLVAGGGLGGVAAAIASARAGARTILVERNGFLGGTATAGMCCSIFNCFFTSKHKLVTRGIPLEIANALAEATGYGEKWRNHKGHIIYDLEAAKLVLSRLAEEAGVEMLLGAVISGAIKRDSDGSVAAAIIETKSGREAICAATFVDATGDADLAARAGAHTAAVTSGAHSLCFRMGNVDVDAFVDLFRKNPDQYPDQMDVEWTVREALAQYEECGTFLFPHGGGVQMTAFQQAKAARDLPPRIGVHDTTDACQMHALRTTGTVHVVTGFDRFDGLEAGRISRSIRDGRKMAFIVADVYKRYIPGFQQAYVAGTAANLGVRASRYGQGDFTFTADMMRAGRRQPDAVGKAVGWDHPIRHHGAGAWGVQVLRTDSFDLPYRCLVPLGVEGLLLGAGRSVCSDNPSLLRVMVHTMVVGQAAGAAAAVSARSGVPPRRLDVKAVQATLDRQDVDTGSVE